MHRGTRHHWSTRMTYPWWGQCPSSWAHQHPGQGGCQGLSPWWLLARQSLSQLSVRLPACAVVDKHKTNEKNYLLILIFQHGNFLEYADKNNDIVTLKHTLKQKTKLHSSMSSFVVVVSSSTLPLALAHGFFCNSIAFLHCNAVNACKEHIHVDMACAFANSTISSFVRNLQSRKENSLANPPFLLPYHMHSITCNLHKKSWPKKCLMHSCQWKFEGRQTHKMTVVGNCSCWRQSWMGNGHITNHPVDNLQYKINYSTSSCYMILCQLLPQQSWPPFDFVTHKWWC